MGLCQAEAGVDAPPRPRPGVESASLGTWFLKHVVPGGRLWDPVMSGRDLHPHKCWDLKINCKDQMLSRPTIKP